LVVLRVSSIACSALGPREDWIGNTEEICFYRVLGFLLGEVWIFGSVRVATLDSQLGGIQVSIWDCFALLAHWRTSWTWPTGWTRDGKPCGH
jgi:hypothetical protein